MNESSLAAAGERLPARIDAAVCLAAQRAVPVACPWVRVQQGGSGRVQHDGLKSRNTRAQLGVLVLSPALHPREPGDKYPTLLEA